MQSTSTQVGGLRGTCPFQYVMVNTRNISEYLAFVFYYHVSYKENSGLGVTDIGRCLGVSHRFSKIMSYWILTQKGMVLSRTTLQRLASLDKEMDEIKANVSEFDTEIIRIFKDE